MAFQLNTHYPQNFFREIECRQFNQPAIKFLSQHYLLSIVFFFVLGKLLYVFTYFILLQGQIIENNLINNVCHWDCQWYKNLISHGYDTVAYPIDDSMFSGQANWAFFPLFPLISRGLIQIFNSEFSVIVLNQILFFASMILLYQFCASNYSKNIALIATLILGVSSENIYILSLYTESLFIFLSLLTLHLITNNKYVAAAICCGLLSATKVQGAAMSLPLLLCYARSGNFAFTKKRVLSLLVLLVLSLSGLLIYMVYLKFQTGDFLAFYNIQQQWARFHTSWLHPVKAIKSIHGNAIDTVFAILSMLPIFYFYRQKRYNEFLFLLLCWLMAVLSQNLMGITRFLFANYAIYIFLAICSTRTKILFFCMISAILFFNITITYLWLIDSTYAI
ncbi:glycosyltransferase family 39 protein [Legionella fallonii]|uniref:Glycosyltransferase RgtA/B/C/D-like domain-containing protein n=1 Tax=Legionella fallonii LLAP-10 TaxID=1212491 RepID=A0A098G2Z6_9GAMM|nr:glycosyltransferase family 39 protein [Legionella fallonii]CEG56361.1 membrane protein of unknown function [Legionella fallonii LLAP-10]